MDFKKGLTVICTSANYKVPSGKNSTDSPKYLPFKNKDIKEGKIKVPKFRDKLTIRDVRVVGNKVGLLFEEIVNPEFEYNMIEGKEVAPFKQELLFDSVNFQIFSSRVRK
jgi:hypothetical protein